MRGAAFGVWHGKADGEEGRAGGAGVSRFGYDPKTNLFFCLLPCWSGGIEAWRWKDGIKYGDVERVAVVGLWEFGEGDDWLAKPMRDRGAAV
jgi:hypothetical protein